MDGSNCKNIEYQAFICGTTGNNSILFIINNNETMRITSTGNVGIGTTNTNGYKLNVNGNFYANNVGLKSLFYIQFPSTTTTFNGKSYYAYDIDLTKYTKVVNTSVSGGTTQTRKFKISTFLYSGACNDTLGIFDVEYSIYMSYLSGYTPSTYNGLNVISNGKPENRYLQNTMSQNIFLVKNTFNYITLLSTNISALIGVIIEDQFKLAGSPPHEQTFLK